MKGRVCGLSALSLFFLLFFSAPSYSQVMPSLVKENPLTGGFDFHVHAAPDLYSRMVDSIDLAEIYRSLGMRGFVLKNHDTSTADQTYLIRKMVPGIEVFGGVALNESLGGINPEAVKAMLKFTGGYGRAVWMPTHDAANHRKFFGQSGGIWLLNDGGGLKEEVREVLRVIAENDLILETGHISSQEALVLLKEAKDAGVKRMVVTHAMQDPTAMSLEDMKRCAELGAYIEHVYLSTLMGPDARLDWLKKWRKVSVSEFARAIREVGAAHTIIASDLGQYLNPAPWDGMKDFVISLMKEGASQEEIDLMLRVNPARLLGLE